MSKVRGPGVEARFCIKYRGFLKSNTEETGLNREVKVLLREVCMEFPLIRVCVSSKQTGLSNDVRA